MKKFMEEIVKRAIENYTTETCYAVQFENATKSTVRFEAYTTTSKEVHTFKGYVGSVGEIVITHINGEHRENYIDIF